MKGFFEAGRNITKFQRSIYYTWYRWDQWINTRRHEFGHQISQDLIGALRISFYITISGLVESKSPLSVSANVESSMNLTNWLHYIWSDRFNFFVKKSIKPSGKSTLLVLSGSVQSVQPRSSLHIPIVICSSLIVWFLIRHTPPWPSLQYFCIHLKKALKISRCMRSPDFSYCYLPFLIKNNSVYLY